jgi:peptide-methionine (R)-S-oxide reductase
MGSRNAKAKDAGPRPSAESLEAEFVPKPLSDEEYKRVLSSEQYRVARNKGTERPFQNAFHDSKEVGVYVCVCCGAALFVSQDKYDSKTGWPSYSRAADSRNVRLEVDADGSRTEALCAHCDAHLGHKFADGPTGTRYCINSASLRLHKAED